MKFSNTFGWLYDASDCGDVDWANLTRYKEIPDDTQPLFSEPKVKCDCGGSYFGSHSDWCSTQKPPESEIPF